MSLNMAPTMWSKTSNLRPWKTRHKYTEMETTEHDPDASPSSSHGSLSRMGTSALTEWLSLSHEEQQCSKLDDSMSVSLIGPSTESRFFPDRSPAPRRSGFFTRLKRMWTVFPIRDISWIVASSFTMGSTVFVVHGFFLLVPLIDPKTNFLKETPYATPTSTILGTLIFFVGGYAGFLEGMNLERIGNDIGEMDAGFVEATEMTMRMDDEEFSEAEPKGNRSSTESTQPRISASNSTIHINGAKQPPLLGTPAFIYLPTMNQFLTMYASSFPFYAGLIQFLGVIIFSVATVTSLPGILPSLTTYPFLIPILNLLPATVGALLFFTSAVIQLLSVQKHWYRPEISRAEWHVGFWSAIGGLGFTLAGALPILGTEEASYLGTLADFWGSWAFLIGSLVQLYIVTGYYT